jgi:biotin carboxyl carrier protein
MALVDVPAPMNGTIFELIVGVGDTVNEGDELVILESMKMEIPVESPQSGKVAEILVTLQQQIEEGQPLLRLEA